VFWNHLAKDLWSTAAPACFWVAYRCCRVALCELVILCLFRLDLGTVLGGIFDLDISKSTDFIKHLLKQEKIA
jgi:hypothetical protein